MGAWGVHGGTGIKNNEKKVLKGAESCCEKDAFTPLTSRQVKQVSISLKSSCVFFSQ